MFRPVLYLLLVSEYWLFRYNFEYWQAFSLALHLLVVLLIHNLLMRGILASTTWPFWIAGVVGCGFPGCEMVLWHHLAGYLLFCVFALLSINLAVRGIEERRSGLLFASALLAAAGVFTFEVGIIHAAVTAVVLRRHSDRSMRKFGTVFAVIPLVYAIYSIADYSARSVDLRDVQESGGASAYWIAERLGTVLHAAVVQMCLWSLSIILPTFYQVAAYSRAVLLGLRADLLSTLVNAGVLLCGAAGTLRLLMTREHALHRVRWRALIPVAAFIICYSTLIAGGRSAPRGIAYTIIGNVYYAYVVYAAMGVGMGLCTLDSQRSGETEGRAGSGLLLAAVAGMVCLGAVESYDLALRYRTEFSPGRMQMIESVRRWNQEAEGRPEARFRTAEDCDDVDEVWPFWFERINGQFRKMGDLRLSDALFPERSYRIGVALGQRVADSSVEAVHCSASFRR